jgi:hypothetical protein
VKEPHYFLGFLVYPGNVRPFEGIAVQTAIGKVLHNGQSTMLFSKNMIDLEGQRCGSVGEMAVVTEATSPLSDLLLHGARDRQHGLPPWRRSPAKVAPRQKKRLVEFIQTGPLVVGFETASRRAQRLP